MADGSLCIVLSLLQLTFHDYLCIYIMIIIIEIYHI